MLVALRHRQFGLSYPAEGLLQSAEIRKQRQTHRTNDAAILKHGNLSRDELVAAYLQGIADMASFSACDEMKFGLRPDYLGNMPPNKIIRFAAQQPAIGLVDQYDRAGSINRNKTVRDVIEDKLQEACLLCRSRNPFRKNH